MCLVCWILSGDVKLVWNICGLRMGMWECKRVVFVEIVLLSFVFVLVFGYFC